jgi:hypothetical protein
VELSIAAIREAFSLEEFSAMALNMV